MSFLEQTTYDLALRSLAQQEQALVELRARTGTLLTAASLITSFLGVQAIAASGIRDWVVLALLSFGLSVALSIYVLLPKQDLRFAVQAQDTYESFRSEGVDDGEISRMLMLGLERLRAQNEPTIKRASRLFEVAGVSLLLETVFLAVAMVVG